MVLLPLRTRGLLRVGSRHVYTNLDAPSPPSPQRLCCQVFTFGAACLGLLTVSTLLQQRRQQQQPYVGAEALSARSVPPQAAASTTANISLWNSYSLDETFRLDRLYPWSYLAEPYKTSLLMIDTLQEGFESSVR